MLLTSLYRLAYSHATMYVFKSFMDLISLMLKHL